MQRIPRHRFRPSQRCSLSERAQGHVSKVDNAIKRSLDADKRMQNWDKAGGRDRRYRDEVEDVEGDYAPANCQTILTVAFASRGQCRGGAGWPVMPATLIAGSLSMTAHRGSIGGMSKVRAQANAYASATKRVSHVPPSKPLAEQRVLAGSFNRCRGWTKEEEEKKEEAQVLAIAGALEQRSRMHMIAL